MKIAEKLGIGIVVVILGSCNSGGGNNSNNPQSAQNNPQLSTFTIGGSVSDLVGSGLALQDNGGDNLVITGNGNFTFATALSQNSSYSVTIVSQPTNPAQTCSIANASGSASSNVTSVHVSCAATISSSTPTFAIFPSFNGRDFELWRTDGTPEGTYAFLNSTDKALGFGGFYLQIYPSTGKYVWYKNAYFFADASDPQTGIRDTATLWTTNGTTAGTKIVAHMDPGYSDYIHDLVLANDTLFFTATVTGKGRQLWQSDGTTLGTKPVVDAAADQAAGNVSGVVVYNGALYFTANDKLVTGASGLWKTDGVNPAEEVATLKNGIDLGSGFSAVFGGKLYFIGDDGISGAELRSYSDATKSTALVKDISPGSDGTPMWWLTPAGSHLYFIAKDATHGYAPWSTDGTTTEVIKDFTGLGTDPAFLTGFIPGDNGAMFMAGNVTDAQIWKSEGTAATTQMTYENSNIKNYWSVPGIAYKGSFYYRVQLADNGDILKTDTTYSGGTSVLRPFCDSKTCYSTYAGNLFFVLNNELFFITENNVNGVDGVWLWKTDGSSVGTTPVQLLCKGNCPNG